MDYLGFFLYTPPRVTSFHSIFILSFFRWQGASDETAFPTLGGGSNASSVSSTPIAWGPKR